MRATGRCQAGLASLAREQADQAGAGVAGLGVHGVAAFSQDSQARDCVLSAAITVSRLT